MKKPTGWENEETNPKTEESPYYAIPGFNFARVLVFLETIPTDPLTHGQLVEYVGLAKRGVTAFTSSLRLYGVMARGPDKLWRLTRRAHMIRTEPNPAEHIAEAVLSPLPHKALYAQMLAGNRLTAARIKEQLIAQKWTKYKATVCAEVFMDNLMYLKLPFVDLNEERTLHGPTIRLVIPHDCTKAQLQGELIKILANNEFPANWEAPSIASVVYPK